MSEGFEDSHGKSGAQARPALTRFEFYGGFILLCFAIAGIWISLSTKFDSTQDASMGLVKTLDAARIQKAADDKLTTQAALDTIIAEVRKTQEKTDTAAQANASAALDLAKQNTVILNDLKKTTEAHTSEIKAARNAANAAEVQSAKTYRKVAKPTPKPGWHFP